MKGLEENFLKNFLIDINASYLEKLLKNDNIQKNPDLNAYYEKLIEDIKKCNNQNLYSNSYLISNFMDSNSPTDILAIYKEQAMEIISFINKLIEDLSANTFLIPYSVKTPLLHSENDKQFPKSKYSLPVSGHVKQLLLLSIGPLLHVLQFSWHLSIVLSSVLLQ